MGDVLDAYAEHVYWIYNDSGRLEYRLRDTSNLMNEVLPAGQRKPVYMMEFGIRGFNSCTGKPTLSAAEHLYYRDATAPTSGARTSPGSSSSGSTSARRSSASPGRRSGTRTGAATTTAASTTSSTG